jgi:pimeloyl-ACP methyl ester carboxylesterase
MLLSRLTLRLPKCSTNYTTRRLYQALSLQYDHYTSTINPPNATSKPLFIVHGLFGSKQNWRSLSKALSQRLGTSVYAVDLRNHGTSPHADEMSYSLMAEDVKDLIASLGVDSFNLIGHSM